jgi:hypothetical protein
MSESSQREWGDDILQVDTYKPEAEAAEEQKAEGHGHLKRTTAGQADRPSPPPGQDDSAGNREPSEGE